MTRGIPDTDEPRPPIRVIALHALAYWQSLSSLEEAEEIRIVDDRVYAGRTLHKITDPDGELSSLTLESKRWGLMGEVDYCATATGRSAASSTSAVSHAAMLPEGRAPIPRLPPPPPSGFSRRP